jgi:hypothetical protein
VKVPPEKHRKKILRNPVFFCYQLPKIDSCQTGINKPSSHCRKGKREEGREGRRWGKKRSADDCHQIPLEDTKNSCTPWGMMKRQSKLIFFQTKIYMHTLISVLKMASNARIKHVTAY